MGGYGCYFNRPIAATAYHLDLPLTRTLPREALGAAREIGKCGERVLSRPQGILVHLGEWLDLVDWAGVGEDPRDFALEGVARLCRLRKIDAEWRRALLRNLDGDITPEWVPDKSEPTGGFYSIGRVPLRSCHPRAGYYTLLLYTRLDGAKWVDKVFFAWMVTCATGVFPPAAAPRLTAKVVWPRSRAGKSFATCTRKSASTPEYQPLRE